MKQVLFNILQRLSCRHIHPYSTINSTQTTQFVPKHVAATEEDVEKLQRFLDDCEQVVVLTGAGVSTESGQPDYRSKDVGLYARSPNRPVQFQNFMKSAQIRKRYWLRNYAGWNIFSSLKPNDNHLILAKWEEIGRIACLVTQNVDRLHHKAGSKNVIELHGTSHYVKCMSCTYRTTRAELQEVFLSLNPHISTEVVSVRPDSDYEVNLDYLEKFVVPPCPDCGGILKPDVVFFGESVPGDTVRQVYQCVKESPSLLVIGSSLYVYSAYRFLMYAAEQKKPIAIVNIGPTRADHLSILKIDSKCSDVLKNVKLVQNYV